MRHLARSVAEIATADTWLPGKRQRHSRTPAPDHRTDAQWNFRPAENVADTMRRMGTLAGVKTLHTAYRVSDLPASLSFYSALGYVEIGRIDIDDGTTLTVPGLPDEDFQLRFPIDMQDF